MFHPSNSITGNSTVNLMKNAGNAGPILSIGANTTGIFNDNTDTYTAGRNGCYELSDCDKINWYFYIYIIY